LQRLATNTGKHDPRLIVSWPAIGRPLWDAFRRLSRPASMGGALPITCQEIDACQRLYAIRFTPWELDVLAAFDQVALEFLNKD
jgi:hypothetical protein